MPLFNPLDIEFRLERLRVIRHSDRWWGVEPYVIPVFFKIDGDRYSAVFNIPVTGPVEFSIKCNSDGPSILLPNADLLFDRELFSGDSMSVRRVRVDTTLVPIPFRMTLADIDLLDVMQGIAQRLQTNGIWDEVVDGAAVRVINVAFDELSALLARILGLSGSFENCPVDITVNPSELLNQIEAEFDGLMPGTIGGVFLAMENDDMTEDMLKAVQSGISDVVKSAVNETIQGIDINNLVAEDPDIDPLDAGLSVVWKLITESNLSTYLVTFIYFRIFQIVFGPVVGTVVALWWGVDNLVGQVVQTFDHTQINSEALNEFSSPLGDDNPLVGDGNVWQITGSLRVVV